MFDFLEGLELGKRLFAYGKWYLQVKQLGRGYYLVVDPDAIIPSIVFFTNQSEYDKKYQEILFRRFDKNGTLISIFKEESDGKYKF